MSDIDNNINDYEFSLSKYLDLIDDRIKIILQRP